MSIGQEYRGENMITTAAVWSTMIVILEPTERATMNYPPGSKCEALRLGIHLIILYFISILVVGVVLTRGIFAKIHR